MDQADAVPSLKVLVQLWMVGTSGSKAERVEAMEQFSDSDPIGVVEGEPEAPVRLEAWIACIETDPRLQPPEPVQSVNPFTRQPLTIAPHPGTAYIAEKGDRIGMMAWSEEGAEEIVVYGSAPGLIALAKEVAEHLGGRFRLLDAEAQARSELP